MINKLVYAIVILVLIGLGFSCGDSFLLSDENNKENDIEIISLMPGGIIEQGETLTFKVRSSNEEDQPDKLEINLYTTFGDRPPGCSHVGFGMKPMVQSTPKRRMADMLVNSPPACRRCRLAVAGTLHCYFASNFFAA
jgi:hypothetical protein